MSQHAMTKYPLSWPAGWKRTASYARKKAQFKNSGRPVSIAEATTRILEQLRLLGVSENDVVVSTNLKTRLDGFPRSDQAEPSDPGAAVYWRPRKSEQTKVMAIDQYRLVAGNLGAIAATLEAMRAIERHGGAVILDRAFTGFDALPAPTAWRDILKFHGDDEITYATAQRRYRELATIHHPDRGGSHASMTELNDAWKRAEQELS